MRRRGRYIFTTIYSIYSAGRGGGRHGGGSGGGHVRAGGGCGGGGSVVGVETGWRPGWSFSLNKASARRKKRDTCKEQKKWEFTAKNRSKQAVVFRRPLRS